MRHPIERLSLPAKLHKRTRSQRHQRGIAFHVRTSPLHQEHRAERISAANLQPADVLFFGNKGPKSSPNDIDHTGIYLGNGWFVQSSDEGVTVLPFDGWYAGSFAWGRRPLHEAGLE